MPETKERPVEIDSRISINRDTVPGIPVDEIRKVRQSEDQKGLRYTCSS